MLILLQRDRLDRRLRNFDNDDKGVAYHRVRQMQLHFSMHDSLFILCVPL